MGAATAAALAAGPARWGWAVEGSPFGQLQDDPMLRLPEGFSYTILAETGMTMPDGDVPFLRPPFPDLNALFKQPDGKLLLSTSHEIPAEFPLFWPVPPTEDYDHASGGAITSILIDPNGMNVNEARYNVGGMIANCSGSASPWGTVLTGEEATNTFEADHGFIWEVDPNGSSKTRLDSCGRFEHETAVVDRKTGYVYLTEDSGTDSLLYRMRPTVRGDLAKGGILEAFALPRRWVRIDDPLGESEEPATQGIAKGALEFHRLEGGRFNGRHFYFTETQDDTGCGNIWRLNLKNSRLELWSHSNSGDEMCMPDNIAFDLAGNVYVTEDRGTAADEASPNKVVFVDRKSGALTTFAEVVSTFNPPEVGSDEPTGPVFSPDGSILFMNLQRARLGGVTLAITGPFPKRPGTLPLDAASPRVGNPAHRAVAQLPAGALAAAGIPAAAAAALIHLRRRGRIGELVPDLEDLVADLGAPSQVAEPKRRAQKVL